MNLEQDAIQPITEYFSSAVKGLPVSKLPKVLVKMQIPGPNCRYTEGYTWQSVFLSSMPSNFYAYQNFRVFVLLFLLHILVLPHCEDLNLPPPEPATPEYLTWDHCTKLPELPAPAPAPSSWPPSSLTALGTLDPAPELLPPPSSPHFSWSVRARSLVGVWRVDFKGITSRGEKKKS